MKILIFTSNPPSADLLTREIEKAGHLVLETVGEAHLLVHAVARTTPHQLVLHAPDRRTLEELRDQVRGHFPHLPVHRLHGHLAESSSWRSELEAFLRQPVPTPAPRPYADNTRMVFHDASLEAFWKGKLNRPEKTEGWEKICTRQEARFVLQLQTGRQNHPAAKHYFACLMAQQEGLDQELAYRLVHGSYKALSWSRDLAVKWLALLAHYTSDAELEYLPLAGTPGPAVDYVHQDLSIEGLYAALLVTSSGVKPTVDEAIKELVIARFDGQDESALLALSVKLYGLAKFLEGVGRAQMELMEAWLDPAIVARAEDQDVPRGEHRNAGIFRDFYDLNFIVNSPEPLNAILKGFHAGTTYVQKPKLFPSFAEFRRICQEKTQVRPQQPE